MLNRLRLGLNRPSTLNTDVLDLLNQLGVIRLVSDVTRTKL